MKPSRCPRGCGGTTNSSTDHISRGLFFTLSVVEGSWQFQPAHGKIDLAVNPVSFLREVKMELDKIVWPTRRQALELTLLVIVISVIVGVYVGGLDFVFTSIMNQLIK